MPHHADELSSFVRIKMTAFNYTDQVWSILSSVFESAAGIIFNDNHFQILMYLWFYSVDVSQFSWNTQDDHFLFKLSA